MSNNNHLPDCLWIVERVETKLVSPALVSVSQCLYPGQVLLTGHIHRDHRGQGLWTGIDCHQELGHHSK